MDNVPQWMADVAMQSRSVGSRDDQRPYVVQYQRSVLARADQTLAVAQNLGLADGGYADPWSIAVYTDCRPLEVQNWRPGFEGRSEQRYGAVQNQSPVVGGRSGRRSVVVLNQKSVVGDQWLDVTQKGKTAGGSADQRLVVVQNQESAARGNAVP